MARSSSSTPTVVRGLHRLPQRQAQLLCQIAVLGVHRDGGMCERISVPASNVYPAGGLTLDQAASIEFLAIGAHAVSRSGLFEGG